MLRGFIGKLQKRFSASAEDDDRLESDKFEVPDDLHEGHFAVLAMKGSEKKRFIVKIECINRPEFIRLLEQAEQEYGFEQAGALVVPCSPRELQKILNV